MRGCEAEPADLEEVPSGWRAVSAEANRFLRWERGQMTTPATVRARWNRDAGQYEIQARHDGIDAGDGWYSQNGNDWIDVRTGAPVTGPIFEAVTIQLVGGPRHGEMVRSQNHLPRRDS